ncbi:MAG: hypothetical protein KO217_00905 [Methanobacteriaceae archaeon]|jgi:hypothetical protein|nr:MAG: hypothetical protein CIT01_02690 [Methanobacterium sp. BRmetb2]MCC7557228.1 hypothetical protein [Methanobacteriaceae archaeon]
MTNKLTLKITAGTDWIRVAAKNAGEVSIKTIELKLLMGHCWWEGLPAIETLLNVLESNLKDTISEVYPHQEMILDYNIQTNDSLEDASQIEIQINEISVDEEEFGIIGDILYLEGLDNRGIFKKITSFRRKINENVCIKL